jgi:hypothetical protein
LESAILEKIRKQSNRALIAIWVSGAIAFVLLSFAFFTDPATSKKPSNKKHNNSSKKDTGNIATIVDNYILNAGKKDASDNQAYVFVNINRKFFLTKFVAYVPDQELNKEENSDSTKAYIGNITPNTIVQRKPKYSPQKTKPVDFEIKELSQ